MGYKGEWKHYDLERRRTVNHHIGIVASLAGENILELTKMAEFTESLRV